MRDDAAVEIGQLRRHRDLWHSNVWRPRCGWIGHSLQLTIAALSSQGKDMFRMTPATILLLFSGALCLPLEATSLTVQTRGLQSGHSAVHVTRKAKAKASTSDNDKENADLPTNQFSIDSFAQAGEASPLAVDIHQLNHRIWTTREGAPEAVVNAMDQTPDGYLWIGTESGLVRFDGVHFDLRIGKKLPQSSIKSLFAESDGDLWIGYTFGGISRLHGNTIVNYDLDSLAAGGVFSFVRGPDGALYAGTSRYLLKLMDDNQWRPLTSASGYLGSSPLWIGVRKSAMWILDSDDAYVMYTGRSIFEKGDRAKLETLKFGRPDNEVLQGNYDNSSTLTDSSGAFWFEDPRGLEHYRWTEAAGKTSLSKEFFNEDPGRRIDVVSLFADREHNVWAATRNGLEKFSPTKFTSLITPDDLLWPIIAFDHQARMWMGSYYYAGLIEGNQIVSHPDLGKDVGCVSVDWHGTVWTSGAGGLHGLTDGKLETLPLPPDAAGPSCQGIAGDVISGLWMSIARAGLYELKGGAWIEDGGRSDLPHGPAIRVIGDDSHRIWFTYPEGKIAVLDNGAVRLYTPKDGLMIGNVLGLFARGNHVWATGDKGVAYLDGSRFRQLRGSRDEAFVSTSGVVETADGDLWLNSLDGVFRIAATEIKQAQHDPEHRVGYERFDEQDGLPAGRAPLFRPGPSMALGPDGRVWVMTLHGVAWIDPTHILRNTVKPIVSALSLTSGNSTFEATETVHLPALTTDISIEYTAASLTRPDRVQFQYQLYGIDKDWQQVGTRRTAYYTNLGPGDYHFAVTATNEDGITSPRPVDVYFTIAPAFYQAMWFKVLCGIVAFIVVGLVLLALHVRRLRQVAGREQMRFRERLAERERIARDLHDTLLQDIQTLVLQVGLVGRQNDVSIRSKLADLFSLGQRTVVNARDRVSVLRNTGVPQCDLTTELQVAGSSLGQYYPAQFDLSVVGTPRTLDPIYANEILSIGREAITNAFRHAQAATIKVTVNYGEKVLRLVIDDDGIGMDPSVASDIHKQGHWGVLGMRERAANMGATFRIVLRSPQGTRVELVVQYNSGPRHESGAT
jgi:signal transduction histidine kinase/ligand-binding sensor domain-containing protein